MREAIQRIKGGFIRLFNKSKLFLLIGLMLVIGSGLIVLMGYGIATFVASFSF